MPVRFFLVVAALVLMTAGCKGDSAGLRDAEYVYVNGSAGPNEEEWMPGTVYKFDGDAVHFWMGGESEDEAVEGTYSLGGYGETVRICLTFGADLFASPEPICSTTASMAVVSTNGTAHVSVTRKGRRASSCVEPGRTGPAFRSVPVQPRRTLGTAWP